MRAQESERSASPRRELPNGWHWVQIGNVCTRRIQTTDPRQTPDRTFTYIDISAIDNRSKRIVSASQLNGAVAPSRARQVVQTQDVLVSTTRPNLNAVAMIPAELNGQICSTGFCVLRATEEVVPEYIFAFVQSADFVQNVSELVKGALYPSINDAQVRAQWMPLPPLAEQQRIAALLTEQMAAVERARAAAEAQVNYINSLPAVLITQAFGGNR